MERFRNRRDAGARLGRALSAYARHDHTIVLGLPRGGVPVAYEVATALDAALDILVVRKLGIPGYEEIGMGAIASGGIQVVDQHVMRQLGISPAQLRTVVEREACELARREEAFRGSRPPLDVEGRAAIVVDDGLATGSTMVAAITALRLRAPASIAVAVPVGAPAVVMAMRTHVDELVCLVMPDHLEAVGDWYDDFTQTTDDEVRALMRARTEVQHGIHPSSDHPYRHPLARRSH